MSGDKVTVGRAELVRILRSGRKAGQAGRPATACPYSPAGDRDERLRAAAWVRGWVRSRR